LATSLPKAGIENFADRRLDCGYSNAKMRFQSFFMLTTDQPFFFASS
jgi:hypothetical protein